MTLDLSAVGSSTAPEVVAWSADEPMLYAVGVGAGQADPVGELSFTTENSEGHSQRVLPTFGVILAEFRASQPPPFGEFDDEQLVQAEQRIECFGELPPSGSLEVTSTLDGIYDKGSGALVVTSTSGRIPGTGRELLRTRSSVFIRGAGGFGIPSPNQTWERPEGQPDLRLSAPVRPDQALIYRLSGDRNPLHSDPAFAERSGFARPILHGLCTFGIVGRLLLNAYAESDPDRFSTLEGRFSAPVYPGDDLAVDVWEFADGHRFVVRRNGEDIVLDRGVFELAGRTTTTAVEAAD